MNTLYCGDNLKILRDYIKDDSVDLIYLDPPFNRNCNYNVLFKNESGAQVESQITAVEDTASRSPIHSIHGRGIFLGVLDATVAN
jgi:16S rRNA G966 N2-methylase RsmD